MAIDQDNIWKEIIPQYISEFLAIFWPLAYQDIDWSKPPEFLDKELNKINRRGKLGKRLVDKLVKVFLKNGEETWLLIHIEIQSSYDVNFAKRMKVYNDRISDYYDKEVNSLAILTDSNNSFRPTSFTRRRWGSRTSLEFAMVKLLDYRTRWEELEQNPNPFAVVVMAYLKVIELGKGEKANFDELYRWKKQLARMLYQRSYTQQKIVDFLWFIDWLVTLPPLLEARFDQEVEQLEQEAQMPFVSNFEKRATARGLEQGREQGLQQGLQVLVLRLIKKRFGEPEAELQEGIGKLNTPQLEDLGEALLDFNSKAELQVWLDERLES